MALKLYDTLMPDGDYPLMKAKDVEMPDGTRLSEFKGGGGGSVSWEDVTDKPFYEVEGEKEILAETTITVDVGIGETTAPLIGLTAGADYRIVWNGTEYTATAIEATLLGYQAVVVGNTALVGGENSGNYPFLLGDAVEIGMGYFVAEDKNAGSHTVAIYQDTTVIKPLDPKFLPVATAVDLTAFESDGIIVETYADGSTVTTTMERNAEGKITKITDSNGNVTVLTW